MKVGLALSGGGIRGIAHAGVLKALEESNINIDMIGGTSSGSLVASLYALGYSPYYIYILFKKYADDLTRLNASSIATGVGNFLINKKVSISGLKTGESIEETYNKLALKKGKIKINQIEMPIVIPAVDVSNSKEYVFSSILPEGENNEKYITDITVGKAVRASSSFPVVFSPCEYKQHLFIDGGALNNTPALEIKKLGANKVISVKFDSDTVNKDSNIMDIAMKVVDIMGSKVSEESLYMSDYVITIPSDGTGLLETSKIDYCYKSGYNTVIEHIEEIKKSLEC